MMSTKHLQGFCIEKFSIQNIQFDDGVDFLKLHFITFISRGCSCAPDVHIHAATGRLSF